MQIYESLLVRSEGQFPPCKGALVNAALKSEFYFVYFYI